MDQFGDYAWMYLGSGAAGLAAFIIAFSFPKPRFNVGQAQAA